MRAKPPLAKLLKNKGKTAPGRSICFSPGAQIVKKARLLLRGGAADVQSNKKCFDFMKI